MEMESAMQRQNYCDTKQAADYLQLSHSWLAKLRVYGDGPTFVKLGRRILYRKSDLDDWASNNRRNSTSNAKG